MPENSKKAAGQARVCLLTFAFPFFALNPTPAFPCQVPICPLE